MTVRPLEKSDLPGVAELERCCFQAPWSEESLAMLCGENAFGYVAVLGERVAAYVGVLCVLDEAQITDVATHPDFRRQGLAESLMRAVLERACARGVRTVTLEVRESNAPACALYRKLGFSKVGRRPHFYTHPAEAALVLLWQSDRARGEQFAEIR